MLFISPSSFFILMLKMGREKRSLLLAMSAKRNENESRDNVDAGDTVCSSRAKFPTKTSFLIMLIQVKWLHMLIFVIVCLPDFCRSRENFHFSEVDVLHSDGPRRFLFVWGFFFSTGLIFLLFSLIMCSQSYVAVWAVSSRPQYELLMTNYHS